MWGGAVQLLLVAALTRHVHAQREQRLLVDYMSSYDPTRCTAVDTAPYTGGSSGGFIATHNENHTYFMVDGQNATVTYRYRPRLDLLTYESHLPQQHLGAMFTDARDGVSYQLMGHVTEAFTDNSTLLGSRVSAGSTFTHIRCIALNATASAGPALPLSAPYTMPAVGYNLFAGWGHAAFLDASDTWQLIQLPDTCTQLTEVAVTPIGGNNENDFEPSYCADRSTTGALEYDGYQHSIMMACKWVEPNGDTADRRNTVCQRTIPRGVTRESSFGLYEIGKFCALALDPTLGRWMWLAEEHNGFQNPLFMCTAQFLYPEPPPSASPTPAPDTLSPTYYTQSPTLSAAPTRSPTPGAAPTAYRVQRHRRATWSSATPVLVLVFGLLFGLMVMYGVRRVVQQKCMADKETTRAAYDKYKLNYSSDAHILDISWEWHARAFMSGSKTFDEDFFVTLARLDQERKERQNVIPSRFGIMGDLMDRGLDFTKAGMEAGMDLTIGSLAVGVAATKLTTQLTMDTTNIIGDVTTGGYWSKFKHRFFDTGEAPQKPLVGEEEQQQQQLQLEQLEEEEGQEEEAPPDSMVHSNAIFNVSPTPSPPGLKDRHSRPGVEQASVGEIQEEADGIDGAD